MDGSPEPPALPPAPEPLVPVEPPPVEVAALGPVLELGESELHAPKTKRTAIEVHEARAKSFMGDPSCHRCIARQYRLPRRTTRPTFHANYGALLLGIAESFADRGNAVVVTLPTFDGLRNQTLVEGGHLVDAGTKVAHGLTTRHAVVTVRAPERGAPLRVGLSCRERSQIRPQACCATGDIGGATTDAACEAAG